MFASPVNRRTARQFLISSCAVGGLVLTGCGEIAENLLEEGVEQAVEAESGEDVELDFNGEDGLRIETEEGTMTIDEDGSFVLEGADGETVTGNSTDDGFTVTDGDDEVIFETDEETGQTTMETDDGSFSSGPGIPSDWPGSVPQPQNLSGINGTTIVADGESVFSVTGNASGDSNDYFEDYEATLEGAGFERASFFETEGFRQGTYEGSQYSVAIMTDGNDVVITVTSAAS